MGSELIKIRLADEDEATDGVGGVASRMSGYVDAYRPLLGHPEQRAHLGHMIHGLTSDLERKSSEPIAIMQGLPRRVLQNFVGMSEWAWEPLRCQERSEIAEEIGIEDGMLIIDPSSVPKKGTETVGVARQWCGRLGKVDNCVVGVHASYVGKDGQATLVDSQLFLPEGWANDATRRAKCHVPVNVRHETKIKIGQDIVRRMTTELPFTWVGADEEYGRSSAFRDAIRDMGKYYMVEIPRNIILRAMTGPGSRKARRADDLASLLKRNRRMNKVLVAYGEKQPIVVHAFMLPVTTFRKGKREVRETLLCTKDASGDEHFYLGHVPKGTGLVTAVRKACQRHRVEEVFEEAKGEVGMDHFECRAWHGWHHHMTLVQMAHWFLVREQRRLGKKMSRHHHQHAQTDNRQDHRGTMDPHPNHGMADLQPYAQ